MPFTFSHPSIVLPLGNKFGKYLSMTGLIVGSLTPDFEYFLRMKLKSEISHTFLGTLYFNVPLGLLLCFIFHQLVKNDLINNLPAPLQRRLSPLKTVNWWSYFTKNGFIVLLSIIIGAYSHILWDSFTHHNAYFVNKLHLYQSIGYLNMPIFKILQHLSTLLGGAYLLFYLWKLPEIDTQTHPPKLAYWLGIFVFTFIILSIRLMTGLSIFAYGHVIVSGIAAGMMALVIVHQKTLYLNYFSTPSPSDTPPVEGIFLD